MNVVVSIRGNNQRITTSLVILLLPISHIQYSPYLHIRSAVQYLQNQHDLQRGVCRCTIWREGDRELPCTRDANLFFSTIPPYFTYPELWRLHRNVPSSPSVTGACPSAWQLKLYLPMEGKYGSEIQPT